MHIFFENSEVNNAINYSWPSFTGGWIIVIASIEYFAYFTAMRWLNVLKNNIINESKDDEI